MILRFRCRSFGQGRIRNARIRRANLHSGLEIGDLLTTSDTPGHAMRVGDPSRAFGAVIGKALAPLAAGRGMVPILVALQ